ncbi:MAG: S41 family peptidase [Bacteroidota bacterium]
MRILLYLLIVVLLMSCGINKSSFSPNKKYSPQQLQKDYSIYETMLEESHPGLYWYTSKDSMDYYFRKGAECLKDSLTEPEFRKVLSYVSAKINCGHTSVRSSKKFSNYFDTSRIKIFPLSIKVWEDPSADNKIGDTMTVAANLNRDDSILKRGTIIKKINDKPVEEIVDTLFSYISTDGYNRTHKFQSLSNRGYFGSLYTSIFGPYEKYKIEYLDSAGNPGTVLIPVYNPATDTFFQNYIRPLSSIPHPSRRERKQRQISSVRQLRIDSIQHTAFMELNSFGRGYHLKGFFRHSFRSLKKHKIGDFIIDVRGNGGGSISNSTILSRYLTDHRFKIADSLYAIRKKNTYGRYIQNNFFNRLFISFFTKRSSDGYYHFGYFERHFFNPKKKNHYRGNVYIIIGGNSFSATTLFTSSIIKQDNVLVVGEETGGGAYGNNAWLIPDVTLPVTGVRFRLPLFRLVVDKNYPKTGKGVQPEVEVIPSVQAVRRSADYKLDKVLEIIKENKKKK